MLGDRFFVGGGSLKYLFEYIVNMVFMMTSIECDGILEERETKGNKK